MYSTSNLLGSSPSSMSVKGEALEWLLGLLRFDLGSGDARLLHGVTSSLSGIGGVIRAPVRLITGRGNFMEWQSDRRNDIRRHIRRQLTWKRNPRMHSILSVKHIVVVIRIESPESGVPGSVIIVIREIAVIPGKVIQRTVSEKAVAVTVRIRI